MKNYIGILTFIIGFIICFTLTALAGNADHMQYVIWIAILYLSAVVATCTILIINKIDEINKK